MSKGFKNAIAICLLTVLVVGAIASPIMASEEVIGEDVLQTDEANILEEGENETEILDEEGVEDAVSVVPAIIGKEFAVVNESSPVTDINGDGYSDSDVEVINKMIDNNGLDWVRDDPASWPVLTGFEYSQALGYIYLESVGIVWETEDSIQSITGLSVMNCNLTGSLDISGLTNLIYFDCSDNLLTDLNMNGLSNLRGIDCTSNRLTTLDVSRFSNLEVLNCGYNQLTELNVQGLANLSILLVYNNQLTNLNLNGLSQLHVLWCDNNNITHLDLSASDTLASLTFTKNPMKVLSVNLVPWGPIAGEIIEPLEDFASAMTATEKTSFNGWYDNPDFTGAEITELKSGLHTYYAKWGETSNPGSVEIGIITPFNTWTGSGDAVATIDENLENFVRLSSNAGDLTKDIQYTATSGSTIITLKNSFLSTLKNGDYTFTAHFTNGRSIDLQIKVNIPEVGNSGDAGNTLGNTIASSNRSPKTGDNAEVTLLFWMFFAAIVCSGGVIYYKKRKTI